MNAVTQELLNKISARHFYESKYEYLNNLKNIDLVDSSDFEKIQSVNPEHSRKAHLEEISNKQTNELIETYIKLSKKGVFDNWLVR